MATDTKTSVDVQVVLTVGNTGIIRWKSCYVLRYFWDIVLSFSLDLKKKLLLFATGSDRVPIGGMGEMEFKIIRMEVPNSTSM